MSENQTDPSLNRNEHDDTGGVLAKRVKNYVWNPNTLGWDKETAASAGGGGLVQIQDSAGDNLTSTGNALDVNIKSGSVSLTNDGTFAKETGGNLATIAAKDFATQTTLAAIKAKTDNLDVALSTRTKPADIQQTQLTNGINEVDVVANDTGYNGVASNTATKVIPFTSSGTGGQIILANTDVRGYSSLTLVMTSLGTGLGFAIEFAPNSGGTYAAIPITAYYTGTSGIIGLSATANVPFSTRVMGAYLEIVVSSLTGGTFTGYIILNSFPQSPGAMQLGVVSGGVLQGLGAINGVGDANTGGLTLPIGAQIYNGATYDRMRAANSAANTTGTGLLGTAALGWDGTNYRRLATDASGNLDVNVQGTVPVSGTFFQTTQPVSAASLPLPSGASTSANQTNGNQITQVSNFPASQAVTLSTVPQATLPSAEVNGQTTGTTAGTAVQLPSNSLAVGVIVQAMSTNTTSIFVGISTVSSSNGFELQPGQATSVGVNNTSAVWIVSVTNGDKVCWIGS